MVLVLMLALAQEEDARRVSRNRLNTPRCNAFDLSDEDFINNFRLTKQLAFQLIQELNPFLEPKTTRKTALNTEIKSVNRPVSDSAEVDCASNNVSSGVENTRTVDPAPVAEDFNQIRKNIYDIANYCQSNSVRSLTNEEKILLVENVWKPQPVFKFPSTFSSSSSNHTRSFQMKWLEEFEWLAYSEEKS
ncbi:hypothetical protein AVEN_63914-1 [Araneus ventricosus]|uniref:Uncharacterized protein n=1 Tax=Araneus ventricosus TaxID=182803 RepID=A0A4Y2HXM6_ARAVE|nr:hypothetical protein AVEN_63914-1 [Araneus ventricosus]